MAAWGANHGAVCYGHVGADLITLASIRASRSAASRSEDAGQGDEVCTDTLDQVEAAHGDGHAAFGKSEE